MIFFLASFFITGLTVFGFSDYSTQEELPTVEEHLITASESFLKVNSDNALIGVTWQGSIDPEVSLSYRLDGEEKWSEWIPLESEEVGKEGISGSEPYSLFYADGVRIKVKNLNVKGLKAVLISDTPVGSISENLSESRAATSSSSKSFSTGFNGLTINTRSAWGADESKMTWTPKTNKIQGAVIHHTASSNNYSKNQVAQQIRNIYHYHAVTLRWGDIGYNVIVDKYGGVWEGRAGGLSKQIHAAHAGNANGTTFGISVMGNFSNHAPTQLVQDQVAKTIAWKFRLHNVGDPLGKANVLHEDGKNRYLPRITGHRDVGWTNCPGNAFYSQLPNIRNKVKYYYDGGTQIPKTFKRVAGKNRYITNALIVNRYASKNAPAFVVTGKDFPDSLTASPAVSKEGGALYMVGSNISSEVWTALKTQSPKKIYIIGGLGAVSSEIEKQLNSLAPVERVAGGDRFETSDKVFERFFEESSTTFVATGRNFPDALAASSVSGSMKSPLLLVKRGERPLSEKTVERMQLAGNSRVIVAGGSGVVPDSTVSWFKSKGFSVERVGGKDRWETNYLLNKVRKDSPSTAWVASGYSYSDSLSASVPASSFSSRLVLSRKSCIPTVNRPLLEKFSKDSNTVYFVGGESVVSRLAMSLSGC